MAKQPPGRTYAQMFKARRLSRSEREAMGLSRGAERYRLPSGEVISKRQLQQRAFAKLKMGPRTLEERQRERRINAEPNPSRVYTRAVRAWAKRHGISYREAQRDREFLDLWEDFKLVRHAKPNTDEAGIRMDLAEELGLGDKNEDGTFDSGTPD